MTEGQIDASDREGPTVARRPMRSEAVRTTTGLPGPGGRNWVYGRAGLPCRRCRQAIVEEMIGRPARVTYLVPGLPAASSVRQALGLTP